MQELGKRIPPPQPSPQALAEPPGADPSSWHGLYNLGNNPASEGRANSSRLLKF